MDVSWSSWVSWVSQQRRRNFMTILLLHCRVHYRTPAVHLNNDEANASWNNKLLQTVTSSEHVDVWLLSFLLSQFRDMNRKWWETFVRYDVTGESTTRTKEPNNILFITFITPSACIVWLNKRVVNDLFLLWWKSCRLQQTPCQVLTRILTSCLLRFQWFMMPCQSHNHPFPSCRRHKKVS